MNNLESRHFKRQLAQILSQLIGSPFLAAVAFLFMVFLKFARYGDFSVFMLLLAVLMLVMAFFWDISYGCLARPSAPEDASEKTSEVR